MNSKEFRLFVTNLPLDVTENELTKVFCDHGEVKSVDLKEKVDANDARKKFAFVKLATTDAKLNHCIYFSANIVIYVNEVYFDGKL